MQISMKAGNASSRECFKGPTMPVADNDSKDQHANLSEAMQVTENIGIVRSRKYRQCQQQIILQRTGNANISEGRQCQ